MIGFETIGNATIIAYEDSKSIISTDPWLDGTPYFGSWGHKYQIPDEQKNAIINSKYIWFSHGHPDHVDGASFKYFKNSIILIPDHYGDRIYNFFNQRYKCIKIKSNEWMNLSENIRIKSFSDWNQDASILIEILKQDIIFNQNDGKSLGWSSTIKNIIKNYKNRFLLRLYSWGDADMINLYDQNDKFIKPYAASKPKLGKIYSSALKHWNCNFAIPFSTFHRYVREDSIHMNQFVTPIDKHNENFDNRNGELLPAFIRWDSRSEDYQKIKVSLSKDLLVTADSLGDSWSDELEKNDKILIENYFKKITHLKYFFGSFVFSVAGKDYTVKLSDKKTQIRFSCPRNSLVASINRLTFDDILIGNFMKTQLIGVKSLYPNFTPFVTKYSDNGIANSKSELGQYFDYYKINSADYWRDIFLFNTESIIRENFSTQNPIFKAAKVMHRKLFT